MSGFHLFWMNILSVKRLRFLDLIQDQVTEIETNSEAEQFDADFLLCQRNWLTFYHVY